MAEISEPEERLLGKCLAISWDIQLWYWDWTVGHYETFGELKASCETGCPLCRMAFILLLYDNTTLENTDQLR